MNSQLLSRNPRVFGTPRQQKYTDEDADVEVEVNVGAMGADVDVDTEGVDVGAKMRSVPSFYSCRSHTDLQEEAQRHADMPHLSDDA